MSETPLDQQHNVAIRLRADRNQDLRRYNLPIANDEVAAIIPGDGSEERSLITEIFFSDSMVDNCAASATCIHLMLSALCCPPFLMVKMDGTILLPCTP